MDKNIREGQNLSLSYISLATNDDEKPQTHRRTRHCTTDPSRAFRSHTLPLRMAFVVDGAMNGIRWGGRNSEDTMQACSRSAEEYCRGEKEAIDGTTSADDGHI
ncbi:hypothetical protein H6P81_004099 [Aristolochia fimbriata]|uniref:Uncharacterized protein n=1 Tax=Aristolochia fimbriata TaxID=158543 RepID=A0AAV7FFI6_ARIFI|nr:hypothetical protein H6P81_004099 [Aristolochia fimbriata]